MGAFVQQFGDSAWGTRAGRAHTFNIQEVTMELNAFLDAMVKWGIPLVITAAAGVLVVKFYPPIKAWVEANVDAKQRVIINAIIAQVVETAEASRLKAKLEGLVFDTLKFALDFADTKLQAVGIDIDQDGIALLIRNELYSQLKWDVPGAQRLGVASRDVGLETQDESFQERLWA